MDNSDNLDPDILFSTDDEKTFQYQDQLPSLPVPDLQHTLDRYLDSGTPKPFIAPLLGCEALSLLVKQPSVPKQNCEDQTEK